MRVATTKKLRKVAEMLAAVCREEEKKLLCPSDRTCMLCPFPEKLCEDIKPKDWIKWMKENDGD